MTDSGQIENTDNHLARIVEIVGPAGAGKTTLIRAIARDNSKIRIENLPPVWDVRFTLFFVHHILLLVPTLGRLKGSLRKLTRRELAWMAMLDGWPNLLRKKAKENQQVILLDQGPIFLMAILSEFGPEGLRSPGLQGYWENVYQHWMNTLDMVIWLDAQDEILENRIRNRPDDHIVKDKTDKQIKDFICRYRGAYERLIKNVAVSNGTTQVVKFDTGRNSIDDLEQSVLSIVTDSYRDP